MIEIAIALVWRDGTLLVARRPPDAHLGGLLEFPGGKLLPGESPEACALREVREETGLTVRAIGRRAPIEHVYPERHVRLHPIDCAIAHGSAAPLAASELAWLAPQNLDPDAFPPANRELLRELAGGSVCRCE